MEQQTRTRVVLPSVMMRSGTSKGLFLHQKHLPKERSQWGSILLSAMGSRDGDQRQLDGVGGATSTTSKVAVISKSRRPGFDVEYTFVQIGVGSNQVDFSGNCGNICAGVGPFALDEGLVIPKPGQTEMDVSIFNTNTSQKITQRIKVGPDGRFREDGDYYIGGVKGTASQIKVTFVDPAGSMTNVLFPSGQRQEKVSITSTLGAFTVSVSMIDVANPFVFVDSASMPLSWQSLDCNDLAALELIEAIRRAAAVKMGLTSDEASASLVRGTPKIAVLSPVTLHSGTLSSGQKQPNIHVTSYSMGKTHPSFQLTGAVCLGAAVSIPGTIASDITRRQLFNTPPSTPPQTLVGQDIGWGRREKKVKIEHASGDIEADVTLREEANGQVVVEGVTVSRTARRLFEGNVLLSV
ncbi:PrpF protein-domain-containing protein [Bisporella sp. PMI_857]|nr:PrpF protein-domain-containing protein [Bisporella sp. PMI_857]